MARIHDALSFNFAYAYTNSKVTKSTGYDLGLPLAGVSPQKLSALVDYTWQQGWIRGFGLGIGVRYLSSALGDTTELPGDLHRGRRAAQPAEQGRDPVRRARPLQMGEVEGVGERQQPVRQDLRPECEALDQCFYGLRRDVTVTLDRKF